MVLHERDISGIGMTSQRTRDRMVQRLRTQGISHEGVLEVMRRVPRHLFMAQALASRSYEDTALPIGHGQTISQPYIVARMTELVLGCARPLDKVLEIGTGSGYQAAVLAPFVGKLYTVERIQPLYEKTHQLLSALGYRNIYTRLSDGSWGDAREAPFDAIIATAAAEEVPPALLEQLAVGGLLLIPTGKSGAEQVLLRITRLAETDYQTERLQAVQFVPFVSN